MSSNLVSAAHQVWNFGQIIQVLQGLVSSWASPGCMPTAPVPMQHAEEGHLRTASHTHSRFPGCQALCFHISRHLILASSGSRTHFFNR